MMSVNIAYISLILIWSTTPLAIKWSGEGPGFLFGVTSRMLIGTIACLIIMMLMRQRLVWSKQALMTYVSASLGVFGSMLCVYWGAQYITSGLISVLFGLTPLLTSLFAAWILKENSLSFFQLLGIVLAIAGLIVIFYGDIATSHFAIEGIIAVIMAATLHSFSTVMVKRTAAQLPGIVITTGALLISSLLFLIVWFLGNHSLPEVLPIKAVSSILYLGLVGTVVGFTLFYYALNHIKASSIGLIPLMTPLLALVIGYLFNSETIGWTLLLGTGLILSGLFTHNWHLFQGYLQQLLWKTKLVNKK